MILTAHGDLVLFSISLCLCFLCSQSPHLARAPYCRVEDEPRLKGPFKLPGYQHQFSFWQTKIFHAVWPFMQQNWTRKERAVSFITSACRHSICSGFWSFFLNQLSWNFTTDYILFCDNKNKQSTVVTLDRPLDDNPGPSKKNQTKTSKQANKQTNKNTLYSIFPIVPWAFQLSIWRFSYWRLSILMAILFIREAQDFFFFLNLTLIFIHL